MMLQVGQDFLQLEEESFAWGIAVGIHSPFNGQLTTDNRQQFLVFGFEEGCGGDGEGFVAGGEHGPAVGAAFGDVEVFALFEQVQDGEVVDAALGAGWEAETGEKTPSNSPVRGRT